MRSVNYRGYDHDDRDDGSGKGDHDSEMKNWDICSFAVHTSTKYLINDFGNEIKGEILTFCPFLS